MNGFINVKDLLIWSGNFALEMLRNLISKLPNKYVTFCSRHLGSNQFDLDTIRDELDKFEGGSVDLSLDEESGIAVISLNNPRRLNSMTGQMMVEMEKCVDQLSTWKTGKGVILMGTEGNLCSGGDLTFVRKALHYGREMATFQHHTLSRLLNLPLVSCALIQGHTLGGGAELSTACDFRVMSSKATLGFVQIKMGLTTGWGATTRLTQLLGRHKTLDLLCSGRRMTAEEAVREGLVDYVLPESSSEQEFEECKQWLLDTSCKYNSELIHSIKECVVFCSENINDSRQCLSFERNVFGKFWGGPTQKSALRSNVKHK